MRTLINPLHFCLHLPILQVGKWSFREEISLIEWDGAQRWQSKDSNPIHLKLSQKLREAQEGLFLECKALSASAHWAPTLHRKGCGKLILYNQWPCFIYWPSPAADHGETYEWKGALREEGWCWGRRPESTLLRHSITLCRSPCLHKFHWRDPLKPPFYMWGEQPARGGLVTTGISRPKDGCYAQNGLLKITGVLTQ